MSKTNRRWLEEAAAELDIRDEGPNELPRKLKKASAGKKESFELLVFDIAQLDPEFYESSDILRHIRDYAHSKLVSADALLIDTLAKLSAMVHPSVRVDSPLARASLNLLVAIIGYSGSGKTLISERSSDLLPRPDYLKGDLFRDGVPLGTGEGICAQYHNQTGKQQVRARYCILFTADEGLIIKRLSDRQGSTLGEMMRTAWVGGTIGQANATKETTKIVEKNTYSFAMVCCFQPAAMESVFSEEETVAGTPQRFLFASAIDRTIPKESPEIAEPALWGVIDTLQHLYDKSIDITMTPEICKEIRDRRWHQVTGTPLDPEEEGNRVSQVDPLDSHELLHLVKLSALFAILHSRTNITSEDWRLAEIFWKNSKAVRQSVLDAIMEKHRVKTARDIEKQASIHKAKIEVNDSKSNLNDEEVARLIYGKVESAGKALPIRGKDGLRQKLRSNRRNHFDGAMGLATERGWLVLSSDGMTISLGGVAPPPLGSNVL